MANQDNSGIIILVIAAFVVAVFAVYFLSKLLLAIGIFLIFAGLIAAGVGLVSQDEQIMAIGLIGLVLGLGCAVIGNEGVSFFEENPTGKNLLDNSNKIVNATADAVDSYNNLTKSTNSVKMITNIGG